jgi:hypothetical protein
VDYADGKNLLGASFGAVLALISYTTFLVFPVRAGASATIGGETIRQIWTETR